MRIFRIKMSVGSAAPSPRLVNTTQGPKTIRPLEDTLTEPKQPERDKFCGPGGQHIGFGGQKIEH